MWLLISCSLDDINLCLPCWLVCLLITPPHPQSFHQEDASEASHNLCGMLGYKTVDCHPLSFIVELSFGVTLAICTTKIASLGNPSSTRGIFFFIGHFYAFKMRNWKVLSPLGLTIIIIMPALLDLFCC